MAHNLIIHSDGFLDQNWRGSLQSSSITGATHWYRCSVGIRCPKKIQLRINTITDVHSIFVSEESHDHTPSSEPSKHGIAIFGSEDPDQMFVSDCFCEASISSDNELLRTYPKNVKYLTNINQLRL